MKRSSRNKNKKTEDSSAHSIRWHHALQEETKRGIAAIIFFTLMVISLLSYWGRAGLVGGYAFSFLDLLFGKGYFFVPIAFVLIGFSFLFSPRESEKNDILHKHILATTIIGGMAMLLSSLGLMDIAFGDRVAGLVGFSIGYPFLMFFDFTASAVILFALFVISFLVLFNIPIWKNHLEEESENAHNEEEPLGKAVAGIAAVAETMKEAVNKVAEGYQKLPLKSGSDEAHTAKSEEDTLIMKNFEKRVKKMLYVRPPFNLLQSDKDTPSSGDIRANANIIQRTLQSFGIDVEMSEVSIGPTVTQYALRPADGVKVTKITALNSNLAMALAAHPIRIEAPIPGKSLVGIEIPNRSIALVGLRALIETPDFQNGKPLTFALGRDVTGTPVYADLSKMPHLLVAGATGSGKSVNIHTIITSLLYKNPPDILRLLMIDPKRVELSAYNGIPHLLNPVITDAKKAIMALRWAGKEMENRYMLLEEAKVRDIASYNAEIAKNPEEKIMPYIVIVVDELADLMLSYPREVEATVVRLAQMARAVGIHLIISTQRPSVEVITGLIKANITSRIALQVASQIDSRTILDMPGAEKLLGHGDMLFMAGDTNKPKRIQGSFISESEVKKVARFIADQNEVSSENENIAELPKNEEFTLGDDMEDIGEAVDDPAYGRAKALVIEAQKASTSLLQRRLGLGYGRAAKIIDILEDHGIVGPGYGNKPREVLVKNDSVHQYAEGSEEAKFMSEQRKNLPEEI
ncbi:MAG: DNA translocase FtsK [Patescibacteria group bacterium]